MKLTKSVLMRLIKEELNEAGMDNIEYFNQQNQERGNDAGVVLDGLKTLLNLLEGAELDERNSLFQTLIDYIGATIDDGSPEEQKKLLDVLEAVGFEGESGNAGGTTTAESMRRRKTLSRGSRRR